MTSAVNSRSAKLLLVIGVVASSLFLLTRTVLALSVDTNMVAGTSPSAAQSSSSSGHPYHNLILSDHGVVPSVEVAMYFKTNAATSLSIDVATGGTCDVNKGDKSVRMSDTYVNIVVGTGSGAQTYHVKGNEICSTLDHRSFPISSSQLSQFRHTGLYGVVVRVEWTSNKADRKDIQNYDSGYGSSFRFRLTASGGKTGYIDTDTSSLGNPNNSIVHFNSTDSGFEKVYYPFGIECTKSAKTDAPVSVYDADNGVDGQSNVYLDFYIGTVSSSGVVTPLDKSDYDTSGGKVAVTNSPGGDSLGQPQVDSEDGHPIIRPLNYHNGGGTTTVRIKNMKANVRYVLVVERFHSNQFIYVGLPGDAIYGSPDFTCPTSKTDVCPNISGDQAIIPPGYYKDAKGNCVNGSGVIDCPGDPTISANSIVTIPTLPKNIPSSDNVSGTTSSYGSVLHTYDFDKNSKPTVSDISVGGSPVPLTIKTYDTPPKYQTDIKVDYKPFADDYPYDYNQAQASYTTYYKDNTWKATKYDHTDYICPAGMSYGNLGPSSTKTCREYAAKSSGKCPAGYVGVSGWPNTCARTATPTTVKYYSYVKVSTQEKSVNNTSDGYKMMPCFNRGFSVHNATDTTGLDNQEDPTLATSSANSQVDFTMTEGGIGFRVPPKVEIHYHTEYTNADSPCTYDGDVTVTQGNSFSSSNTCDAHAPPLDVGDMVCAEWRLSPSGDYVDIDGKPQASVDPRGNDSSGTGNGSDVYAIPDPACSEPVTNLPYAHFFGNDIAAGGAFADVTGQCTSGYINGSILTNSESLPDGPSRGSSDQFGAIALGNILGFNSASMRTSDPIAPLGLMFSNTTVPPGQLGTTRCIPDYYDTHPASSSDTTDPDTNHRTIIELHSSGYTINGLNVPTKTSEAIYVNGDVTITSDIKYDSWSSLDDIPSLYVIAKGNIDIGPGVNELDGVYVAQGGTIDTCNAHSFISCNHQLTVFGSLIAQNIKLYRTFSSLRNSTSGERPTGPSLMNANSCNSGDSAHSNAVKNPNRPDKDNPQYDCAAEILIFSPESYITDPALPQPSGQTKFDAISTLSPVL